MLGHPGGTRYLIKPSPSIVRRVTESHSTKTYCVTFPLAPDNRAGLRMLDHGARTQFDILQLSLRLPWRLIAMRFATWPYNSSSSRAGARRD